MLHGYLRLHEKCTIKIKGDSSGNIASVSVKILCLELQRGQVPESKKNKINIGNYKKGSGFKIKTHTETEKNRGYR